MDYQHYQAEDFLMDDSFKKWLLDPDPITTQFWETWMARHPEKAEAVKEAKQLLLLLHFKDHPLPAPESQQVWQTILTSRTREMHRQPTLPGKVHPRWGRVFTQGRKVAAVVTALLLAGVGYFFLSRYQQTSQYLTEYGQTHTIWLPDSSMVTLNANSKLKYSADWDPQSSREVWLEGEAFFSVRKKQAAGSNAGHPPEFVKFVVHTNNLDVNVLGTEFNVNDRRGKTKVVLTSGSIRLDIKSVSTDRPWLMRPGEAVEVSAPERRISKKAVNPAMYSSWKHNQLSFDNTPFSEVATIIEDTYGLKVVFADTSQAQRRIRGVIPRDDIGILLTALSNSFNLRIRQEENQIIIDSK